MPTKRSAEPRPLLEPRPRGTRNSTRPALPCGSARSQALLSCSRALRPRLVVFEEAVLDACASIRLSQTACRPCAEHSKRNDEFLSPRLSKLRQGMQVSALPAETAMPSATPPFARSASRASSPRSATPSTAGAGLPAERAPETRKAAEPQASACGLFRRSLIAQIVLGYRAASR